MDLNHLENFRRILQDSLRFLEAREGNLRSDEARRLALVVHQLAATVKSLSNDPKSLSSLPSNLQSPICPQIPATEDILNLAPDGHLFTTLRGVIQMANYQAGCQFHRNQAALKGVPLSQFVSKADWSVILQHLDKIKQDGPKQEFVLRITPEDFPPCLVSCTISALWDPEGNLRGVHWLLRDYSEQQRINVAEELVQAIGEQVLAGLSLDQTVWLVCRRFVETFQYPLIWIGTKEANGTIKVRAFGGEFSHLLDGYQECWKGETEHQGAAARAIRANVTQMTNKADLARLWAGDSLRKQGIQSGLAIPLAVRNQVLGVLNVYAHPGQTFDSGAVHWLEKLGAQISLGLFLARDYDQLRLRGAAVSSAEHAVCITNPDGGIEWVNEAYCRLTGYGVGEVIGTVLPSFPSDQAGARLSQHKDSLPRGQFWRTELVEKRKDGSGYTVEQILTPLLDEQGRVTNFVAVLQDITARKEVESQMVYRAHHDPLTDLPNRVMFQDRLAQAVAWARRHGRLVSVMFLDLDGFKRINDEFGHGTGDKTLRMVATRLNQCVRATDTVARLSGDEFTIILQDVERVHDVYRVAQKILACLGEPIALEEQDLTVKTSIGIALYPLDGTDPEGLLQHADWAMYQAKALGGQCCCFASEGINLQFSPKAARKSGSSIH